MLRRLADALWPRASDEPLGRRGERLAARWLRRRGYRILHRNLRLGRDEADLVAVAPDGRTMVIVEVKTRAAADPPPEEAFTPEKLRKLWRLARALGRRSRYRDRRVRIDAVAIVWPADAKPTIRHYRGATAWGTQAPKQ